jgi:hypothetical protein
MRRPAVTDGKKLAAYAVLGLLQLKPRGTRRGGSILINDRGRLATVLEVEPPPPSMPGTRRLFTAPPFVPTAMAVPALPIRSPAAGQAPAAGPVRRPGVTRPVVKFV